MPKSRKNDSWWPTPLAHIPAKDFLSEEMVTVAELSDGVKPGSTRDLYLAIVNADVARRLLRNERLLVSCSPGTGVRIENSRLKIESLVTRWEGGANHYVQVPAHRFLCAFGLVPRLVNSVVYWDDMAKPLLGVVSAEMVSIYDFPTNAHAQIQIRRDYLLEYADRTNRAIIALWYEWNDGPNSDEKGQPYTQADFGDFMLPGRMVTLREVPDDPRTVVAELWGVFSVYFPNPKRACTSFYDDVPPLVWPGIPSPVTRRTRWPLGCQELAYVNDSVLDVYEEHPETYTVHPDTGAVTYRNQWSVSYCHRVGRDLIALEVKKLYEGAPAEAIQHWHQYVVPPPSHASHRAPNVATRARRIAIGLAALGEALSDLCATTGAKVPSGREFVGLDGHELGRGWWYDHDTIRATTRRIPLEMGKDAFLDRCEALTKLVIEGLGERHLRGLLFGWNVDSGKIEGLRALKLLDLVLQFVIIAEDTGLAIPTEMSAIQTRHNEKLRLVNSGAFLPSPNSFLFTLYDVRTSAAHRGGNVKELYRLMGISAAAVAAGWGEQLDRIYDRVAESLEGTVEAIRKVLGLRGP